MYLKKICKRKLECILKMLDSFISLTRPFLWSSHWCSMPMSHEQLVQSTVGSKNHWKGHNVENSYKDVPLAQCFKITQNVALSIFCLVTLFNRKLKVVKNLQKRVILWTFIQLSIHSKCKRSSLRFQYWMRFFLWFSNTVRHERKTPPSRDPFCVPNEASVCM